MATKKSSSAAKKKTAPKKKVAKKQSKTVKKQSVREEQTALFTFDESAQASLQSPVSQSEETPKSSKESGNGVYLFLVIAGVAAIGYLAYAKFSKSKQEPGPAAQTKVETPAKKVEEETKPVVEEVKSSESSGFLVDAIASKKWADAASYCKSVNGTLPTNVELVAYSKSLPADKKASLSDKYWTTLEDGKKNAFAVKISTGKTSSSAKTTELKVLCKN
ncbi:hypothetical protein P3G55_16045 [Leptospira sp. 96542]|nr:hypothetical protein [Leptospira sp. 96542]